MLMVVFPIANSRRFRSPGRWFLPSRFPAAGCPQSSAAHRRVSTAKPVGVIRMSRIILSQLVKIEKRVIPTVRVTLMVDTEQPNLWWYHATFPGVRKKPPNPSLATATGTSEANPTAEFITIDLTLKILQARFLASDPALLGIVFGTCNSRPRITRPQDSRIYSILIHVTTCRICCVGLIAFPMCIPHV